MKIFKMSYNHVIKYLGNINEDSPNGETYLSRSGFFQDMMRILMFAIFAVSMSNEMYDERWLGISPLVYVAVISAPISAILMAILIKFIKGLENKPMRFLKGQWYMIFPYMIPLFLFSWFYTFSSKR